MQQNTSTATPEQAGDDLSKISFIRIETIVGDPKNDNIKPIIPMSQRSWMNGVKAGIYPKPVKIGGHINYWRVEDIRKFIADMNAGADA